MKYLRTYFPHLNDTDITRILGVYSTPNVPDSPNATKFPTTGDHPPTSVNQSELASGYQQVACNFYGKILSFARPTGSHQPLKITVAKPSNTRSEASTNSSSLLQTNDNSSLPRRPFMGSIHCTTSPHSASPVLPRLRKLFKGHMSASSRTTLRPTGRGTRRRIL